MSEMRMDDIPTTVKNKASSEQEKYKNQFSNLTTNFFKTNTGHVVFSITGETNGQKTHIQSYVWKESSQQKSKQTKIIKNHKYLDKIIVKLNIPTNLKDQDKTNEKKWYDAFRSPAKKEITTGTEPRIPTQEQRDAWQKTAEDKEKIRVEKQKEFTKTNITSKNPKEQQEQARLASIEQQKAKQAQEDAKWWRDAQTQSEKEQSRMLAEARGKAGEDFAAEGKREVAKAQEEARIKRQTTTSTNAQLHNFEKHNSIKNSNTTRTSIKSGAKVNSPTRNDKEEDRYASVVSSGNSKLSR
jgi:hypothetical protein